MEHAEFFPFIEVYGTPAVRGQQHGEAAKSRVQGSIDLYQSQLSRRGITLAQQKELARKLIPSIQAYEADYLEEMQGMATGAGVDLEDIITVNCRTEMMFGHQQLNEASDGCTGLIVLPEGSASKTMLHAHNWDWREECIDTGIVVKIKREQGPDVLTFTEAGALARHGVNSAGLSLSGNFLACERDYQSSARVPLVLLRRKMLEAENICAALKTAWTTPRYCSNNLMLTQGNDEAINLECAPDEIFWLQAQQGLLVHANHWLCPVARGKLRDTGLSMTPDSLYRQRRVEQALKPLLGTITWDHIKTVLADDFAKPDGVLRFPKPSSFNSISATVATTLMEPANGIMHIARKPYGEQVHFHTYRL